MRLRLVSVLFWCFTSLGLCSRASAEDIKVSIGNGENLQFVWTDGNGKRFLPAFTFDYKLAGGDLVENQVIAKDVDFDWNNLYPDNNIKGKACDFIFKPPNTATGYEYTIIDKNGKKKPVMTGNIKKNSPWKFYALSLLPPDSYRVPELIATGIDSGDTIYTAVNLDLYITNNPNGFAAGNWHVGQTLADLDVEIVNGQVETLQGIYWATTPFEFDSDSSGPGFVPRGGAQFYLNSVGKEASLQIAGQSVGAHAISLPILGVYSITGLGVLLMISGVLVYRRI